MPRLRGKYDHFLNYPKEFRLERNFLEPLERLAEKDPHFSKRIREIRHESETKKWHAQEKGANPEQIKQILQQADQQAWKEIETAIQRQRMTRR